MQKYDSYKDSGIEWIGKIPSHWEVQRIKYLGSIIAGSTPNTNTEEFWDGNISWITPADMKQKFLSSGNRSITEKGLAAIGYKTCPKGSVIMSTRAPVGTLGIAVNTLTTNQGCKAIIPKKGNSNYIYYMLMSNVEVLKAKSNTTTFDELGMSTLSNHEFACPPLSEQFSISDYLDAKCTKIDNLISTQQKRIELLKELKQSVITRAVTRGINPDVKMKNSGVEWIGEVPEHWEVVKIKNVLLLLTDYDANGSFADIAKNCNINNGNPYAWMVRATDLENKRYGIVDGNNYCDYATYLYLRKSSLEPDDLLIAKRGEIGKSYLVPDCKDPMTLAPNTYLLKTKKDVINNRYFYYYLQSGPGHENLKTLNKSTTLGALYKDDVKSMSIPLPSRKEQDEIVASLEVEVARMDRTISCVLRQIELLKEYKQSLITEVVTGKRKVC